jgi:alkylation response protein AidB-like acyl-CoA dehydrogenase
MNFDFSEDQKLLQKTVRDYLTEHAPLSVCRDVLESKKPYAADLWKGAAELGWLGTAIPEEYGGAGFGQLELALVAEEIGRALAPIPFSSSVYLATEAVLLAGSDAQRKSLLPRLASGELIGTLAWAEKPGAVTPASIQATFAKGRLRGVKLPVADGEAAGLAVVVAKSAGGLSLALADLGADGVRREAVESFDGSRPQARVTFEDAPAELLGAEGQGAALLEKLLDRAAVLMAFEQVGSAQRALEITREFTLGRYAFGRPVASFQAIKHRLADLWVAVELARSNAYYGAWALAGDEPELGVAACGARVSATDALDLAGVEMVQMHGGVGFTWEYDCHLFYRRSKLLGLALGSAREWRDKLIRRLDARHAA